MSDQPAPRHRNPYLLASLALASFAALLFAWTVIRHTGELSHGFAAYYTSARLVLDGEQPELFYQNRWFMEQTIRLGFGDSPDIYNVNPPTTSLIFLPLAWLTPVQVDYVWSLLNVGFLAVAVWFLFKALILAGFELIWSQPLPWLLIAIVLLYNPIYLNFRFGQAYLLALMLLSIAIWAYLDNRDRLVGMLLALALLLKSAGALLWLVPLLDRRFRTIGWGIGTVAAGIIFTSPLLGPRSWWEYVQWLPGLTNRPFTGVTAYQTAASFVHHFTRMEPRTSPQPLVDAPLLAQPLTTLLAVSLLIVAVAAGWLVARELPVRRGQILRLSLLLALVIPLQPVGEEHNYTILLPVVFVTVCLLAERAVPGIRRELILLTGSLGVLLLAVPLPFLNERLVYSWHAFFAYPKLYGALLLAATMAIALADDPARWRALARRRLDLARRWRPAREHG